MITLIEVLQRMGGQPSQSMIEDYIAHSWVRPVERQRVYYFEEIDIARIRLVHHLRHEIQVNDEGMDVALNLLDQVYALREQMRRLQHAVGQQPSHIRQEFAKLLEAMDDYSDV